MNQSFLDQRYTQTFKDIINTFFVPVLLLFEFLFIYCRKDKHFQTSPNYPGLDLSLAKREFENLIEEDILQDEVRG